MTTKDKMVQAIKTHCVSWLRQMGFKGSFPHFYRDRNGFVCLVNFQFRSTGGAFCINLGFADPARRNVVGHCQKLDPRKLRVSMTGCLIEEGNALSGRWRLGSKPLGDGTFSDSWFSFTGEQPEDDEPATILDRDELAVFCAKLLDQEAEAWWTERQTYAALVAAAAKKTDTGQ